MVEKTAQELIDEVEEEDKKKRGIIEPAEKVVKKASNGKSIESLKEEIRKLESRELMQQKVISEAQEKKRLKSKIKSLKFKQTPVGKVVTAGKTVFGRIGTATGDVLGGLEKASNKTSPSVFSARTSIPTEKQVTPRQLGTTPTPQLNIDAKINEIINIDEQFASQPRVSASVGGRKVSGKKKGNALKPLDINKLLRDMPQ